jgi:hypothetical protein
MLARCLLDADARCLGIYQTKITQESNPMERGHRQKYEKERKRRGENKVTCAVVKESGRLNSPTAEGGTGKIRVSRRPCSCSSLINSYSIPSCKLLVRLPLIVYALAYLSVLVTMNPVIPYLITDNCKYGVLSKVLVLLSAQITCKCAGKKHKYRSQLRLLLLYQYNLVKLVKPWDPLQG